MTNEGVRTAGLWLDLDASPSDRKDAARFLRAFDLANVPAACGCYLMYDAKERLIYVGKAKSLRVRLRTYVNAQDSRYSVKFLMQRVARVEFLVTTNEKEALLLENSLIKQHKPAYNIRLKDDKTYVSLRLNVEEDFPRLAVVRRYKKDGAKYFGPYSSAQAVRETLKQMRRLFPLRLCTDHVMRNRTRPCLYYEIKQCAGPCVGLVDREAYREIVDQAALALRGRTEDIERQLVERIRSHADALEFERAAVLRDRLSALRHTMERQRTVAVQGAEERDAFGIYGEGRYAEIQVMFYRGGKLLGGRSYSFEQCEMPRDELVGSFLLQYYAQAPVTPGEVLTPVELEEAETLAEILAERRGGKVEVIWPQRGEKKALVDLASRNAASSFAEKRLAEKANADVLEQLRALLGLAKRPDRIECFDISTLQGTRPVGSMAVFENGLPNKKRYRHYAVRSVEGQDDFAMLREVLMRRYRRAIEEDDLPDLAMIDGGRGQLNVALAVFEDLGIEDLPAVGIAKSRAEGDVRSPERLFVPGRVNPIVPPRHSAVVRFLAHVRDEAHRFAIGYHRKKRKQETLPSILTQIPGVGSKRAKALLTRIGSLAKIGACSVETLATVPGFGAGLARTVQEYVAQHLRNGAERE